MVFEMALSPLLNTCISDSSKIPQFYLKYFNWMVQVISVQCTGTYQGSGSAHILRVWDGHFITPDDKDTMTFSLSDAQIVVPTAKQLKHIPPTYFFDVMLYGEWITKAATLKSGSIVVLKNVHFARSNARKKPILIMHEGNSHGRDIVSIEPETIQEHYRYIRLTNDINRVLEECNGHLEESETMEEEEKAVVSIHEGSPPTVEPEVDSMDQSFEQFNCSNSSEEEISDERRAALIEAFFINADPRAFLR